MPGSMINGAIGHLGHVLHQVAWPLTILVVHSVLAELFLEQRIRFQRRWMRRIRRRAADMFGLHGFKTIDSNGFEREEGRKALGLLLACLLVYLGVVFLIDGNLRLSLSVILAGLATALAMLTSSRSLVHHVCRATYLLQVFSMANYPDHDAEILTRRAALIRSVAVLTMCEAVDDSLVQLGTMTWITAIYRGSESAVTFLPMRIFCLFSLPICLAGAREMFCSETAPGGGFGGRLNERSILAISVPTITFLYAFSGLATQHATDRQRQEMLLGVVGVLEILLFVLCMALPRLVDETVMPCFCGAIDDEEQKQQALSLVKKTIGPSNMDEKVSDFLLLSSSLVFLASILVPILPIHVAALVGKDAQAASVVSWLAGKNSIPWLVFFGSVLAIICLIRLFIMVKPMGSFTAARMLGYKRNLALAAHTVTLAFALLHPLGGDVQVVALATSRIPLTFEKQKFSQIEAKIALFAGISNVMIRRSPLSFILVFVSVATQAFCAVICLSRENVAWIVQQEKDVQSFVHHQMKQKFSGVGSAIENILEACEDHPKAALSKQCTQLLVSAMRECRRGHDGCHTANVMRSIARGRYLSKTSAKTLRMLIEEWNSQRNTSSLEIGKVTFSLTVKNNNEEDDDEFLDVPFMLDWELFRLILSEWVLTVERLEVQVQEPPQVSDVGYLMVLALKGKKTKGSCNRVLARAIDGEFSEDGNVLVIRLKPGLQETVGQPSGQTGSPSLSGGRPALESKASLTPMALNRELGLLVEDGDSAALPSGLTYAVLDDNLLVRRNLERVISLHLKGSKGSFSRGASPQESMFFPHEIFAKNVDIAIFDENLDFDLPAPPRESTPGESKVSAPISTTTLKGSKLAVVARQLGFKGCMVLHSAHADINTCCQSSHVFDGFVEKTASRHALISGLEAAWLNHVGRHHHIDEQSSSYHFHQPSALLSGSSK